MISRYWCLRLKHHSARRLVDRWSVTLSFRPDEVDYTVNETLAVSVIHFIYFTFYIIHQLSF